MKKKIELVLMMVLLLASNSIGGQRTQQPVELRKISDRLFEIAGGRGAQGGAYIGDDGVLVIDAKMDKTSVDQVIEAIKRITDKPIKYLVNTHSDGDHVAGNRYFPETVTIISHENCRKDFSLPGRNGAASEWTRPDLAPFVPSVTFSKKMNIHLGSKTVELLYFGVGHTTGDIVIYFPEEKTAFIGDQIFLTRAQLIHSYKGGNSFEHVKTLTKMLGAIDAGKFCSGHSEMTNRAGIENHIGRMKKWQEKIRALIVKGKSTEEIKSEFEQSESRLVESICDEINKSSR
jgi:cyclase